MSIRGDDILCTPLYYVCFIRVLDGVLKLQGVAIMGRGTKKVETNWVRKILHSVKKDDCRHSNHTQKRLITLVLHYTSTARKNVCLSRQIAVHLIWWLNKLLIFFSIPAYGRFLIDVPGPCSSLMLARVLWLSFVVLVSATM